MRRGPMRTTDLLLPLAVLAAALALLVPSHTLAERSDLVLAALVLFTALGIAPARLVTLRERRAELAALVFGPFALLVPLAWLVSRLFDGPVREGCWRSASPRPRSQPSAWWRSPAAAPCSRSGR